MPSAVVSVRVALCVKCEAKCEPYKQGAINHADPCATCPASPRRWSTYGQCARFGLGDAVAAVAQPIARVLDGALGTNIQNCGGCKARREALNRLVPEL